MSQCAPDDRNNTINRLNREPQCETPSWLRHRNKRGATIDYLLLHGATMEEMIKQSESSTEASVRGHLAHIQLEHKLPITRARDGKYSFDFDEHRDVDEQEPLAIESRDAVPTETPDKEKQTQILQIGLPLSVASSRKDKQVFWGVVITDEQEAFRVAFGKENIRKDAPNDLGHVIFAITGPDLTTIKKAIDLIIDIASSYEPAPRKTWHLDCQWPPSQYYVYRHLDGNGVFYVGKGIKERGKEHLSDAIKAWKAVQNKVVTRKHQKILDMIQHGGELSDRLVSEYKKKSIQSYPMPMIEEGEIMAFLAEDFIITHLHGVYELTNETGGNSKSKDYNWLSQPKNSAASPKYWAEACGYFLENKRLSSAEWAKLTKINADGILALVPDALKKLSKIDGITVGEHSLIGQDVFIDLTLQNMPFRVQLLFSSKNPTVKFNLRPPRNADGKVTSNERKKFEKAYVQITEGNNHLTWKICIEGANDCYIKPFVKKDKTNTDPTFSILDLEEREAISLRGIDDFQERNLIEAVEYVWQVFLSNVTD